MSDGPMEAIAGVDAELSSAVTVKLLEAHATGLRSAAKLLAEEADKIHKHAASCGKCGVVLARINERILSRIKAAEVLISSEKV